MFFVFEASKCVMCRNSDRDRDSGLSTVVFESQG